MKKILSRSVQAFFSLLARVCLWRHRPFVIGVTGSFGKTTARHIITEILRSTGRNAWTPEGNYNGEWGLAFSILQVHNTDNSWRSWLRMLVGALSTCLRHEYPDILVLEYGVDHVGEMNIQTDIVEPDVALLTTLSPSHIVGFGTEESYFHEKEKILRRSHKNTFAVGNLDDDHQKNFSCQIWYGHTKEAQLQITSVSEYLGGFQFDFIYEDHSYHIVSPILGGYHAGLLAGAFLVARHMEIPAADIVRILAEIHLPPGRGNIISGVRKSLVIDGTYNGGFEPIIAGVTMLAHLSAMHNKKTLALIGDMRELGVLEKSRHEELWELLASQKIDGYVFVGAVCMEVIHPLIDVSWREKTFFTLDARVAGKYIHNILQKDSYEYIIFAKGSQNTIYLEEALKYFIPPEEYSHLVRQDSLYMTQKNTFFKNSPPETGE